MTRRALHALVTAAALTLLPTTAPAAAQPPTFEQVTGHAFGERITLHHEMVRYLERLADTSDRVTVIDQGTSWEGRALPLAVVTSPDHHARLDEIRATSARLADPRAVAADELADLLADQPAIVWLGGSIHGFELSGSEAVLKLLERLATADDPETLRVLDATVVLIDPMLNPDGREAFAQTNHRRAGAEPNPRTEHWANDYTSWEALGFRTGHYFFDTNRDWFAQTQAETRARVPTLLAWKPQVMVDLHEMGTGEEFFFDPPAQPYGPSFPRFAREWFPRFGRAYAEAFDRAGFEYMTGERFNYFYPGYTTSFGSYQGAVSMLFEQSSSRGLALERPDESVRTLAGAVERQSTAAWAAVRTAAAERAELLRDFHDAQRRALEDGRQGVRRYLISGESGDPGHRRALGRLLLDDGIEVSRLTEEVRVGGLTDRTGAEAGARTFPRGTWVVEAAQPRNRLVRTLLAPDQPLSEDFLEAARARVERGENPRFYDVTSWSLPLLFDLEVYGSAAAADLPTEPLTDESPAAAPDAGSGDRPGYAYLLDGTDAASVAALFHLRRRGVRATMLTAPTMIEDRAVPRGTVVVRARQRDGADGETIHAAVGELAREYDLAVRPVDTGLADPEGEAGPATGTDGSPDPVAALGTGGALAARPVEIALLAGGPVHGYSFGWAWYTLDRQYRIPVTVLRVDALAGTPLAEIDTLVVPDLFSAEALAEELGEEGRGRLQRWIEDGGTLVAIGEGVDFVREHLERTGLRSWYAEQTDVPGAASEEEGAAEPAEPAEGIEPIRYRVPGAVLRGAVDRNVWLTAGLGADELPLLVDSARILLPPEGPPSPARRVAVRYASGDDPDGEGLLLSGHAWPESLERLPGAVFASDERVGRGRVIAFAEDVNFRGFWRGADRLFLNAMVLGPAAP